MHLLELALYLAYFDAQLKTKQHSFKPMKTKQSFAILSLVLFLICINKGIFAQNNTDSKNAKFICTNDYGFISKEKGFAFLLANSLIDTTKKMKKWNQINQNDTIGRYYRINNSENYLMCLPRSLDSFKQTFLIIMINAQGKMVKNEKYDFGNAHEWNTYYKDFSKHGNFFEIIAQGGYGCGQYHYMNLYLFKELVPQDSIKYSRIEEQKIMYKNKNSSKEIIKVYWASFEIKQNKLNLHYSLYRGRLKFNNDESVIFKFRRFAKNKFTIKYIYENEKWITDDTIHLKKLDQFMEVKPYQFKL